MENPFFDGFNGDFALCKIFYIIVENPLQVVG